MTVIPIIMSGGSGTRLWPLSRASKPKQFLSFGTKHSLIQETLLRCRSPVFSRRPIVVGADAHRFLLAQDLEGIGVAADILLEPVARNTAPAIAAAAFAALALAGDAGDDAPALGHDGGRHQPGIAADMRQVDAVQPHLHLRVSRPEGLRPRQRLRAGDVLRAGQRLGGVGHRHRAAAGMDAPAAEAGGGDFHHHA